MAEATELFNVNGLVAVISGGGTGIGLMMAKGLARNGANKVYIIGRRLEKLQDAAAQSTHGNIIPVQGDVTSKESLSRIVNQIEHEVGYIHLLICNSGTAGPQITEKIATSRNIAEIRDFMWAWDPQDMNDMYALNDTASFFTVIAFHNLLDAGNKRGTRKGIQSSVVITASIAAHQRVLATGVAYITSKAAALSLAKLLCTFFAPHGIRVNALCPGIFPSEMTEGLLGQTSTFSLASVPAGRTGTEEDMVGTIVWLASRAGAYVNGLTLVIDGGRLSQLPATN